MCYPPYPALSSRVMIGICAPDAAGGVAALKAWTGDLGKPYTLRPKPPTLNPES